MNNEPNEKDVIERVKQTARNDLAAFIYFTNPSFPFARHQIEISDVLNKQELKTDGYDRVAISLPPGHAKSTTAIVFYVAYLLGRNPSRQILIITGTEKLARNFSRSIRDLIQSERYLLLFPHVQLRSDQAGVDEFGITAGGGVTVGSVGGSILGRRAHFAILDDTLSPADAASPDARENVHKFFDELVLGRAAEKYYGIVVIGSRVHQMDLIGYVLAKQAASPKTKKWIYIRKPARSDNGEVLWEAKFGKEYYDEMEIAVGPFVWLTHWQGVPTAQAGTVLKAEYFQIEDEAPLFEETALYFDLASSLKERADYSAYALVAKDAENNLWILDMWRDKMVWPDLRRFIVNKHEALGDRCRLAVDSRALGLMALQDLKRLVPIIEVKHDSGKDSLMSMVSGWAVYGEAGKLKLKRGAWNAMFIQEALDFGMGTQEHDDLLSAVSGAYALLRQRRGGLVEVKTPPPHGSWSYYQIVARNAARAARGSAFWEL